MRSVALVRGAIAGFDRVTRVLNIFENCQNERLNGGITCSAKAFYFSERCRSRLIAFLSLFGKAFLAWETSEER